MPIFEKIEKINYPIRGRVVNSQTFYQCDKPSIYTPANINYFITNSNIFIFFNKNYIIFKKYIKIFTIFNKKRTGRSSTFVTKKNNETETDIIEIYFGVLGGKR